MIGWLLINTPTSVASESGWRLVSGLQKLSPTKKERDREILILISIILTMFKKHLTVFPFTYLFLCLYIQYIYLPSCLSIHLSSVYIYLFFVCLCLSIILYFLVCLVSYFCLYLVSSFLELISEFQHQKFLIYDIIPCVPYVLFPVYLYLCFLSIITLHQHTKTNCCTCRPYSTWQLILILIFVNQLVRWPICKFMRTVLMKLICL